MNFGETAALAVFLFVLSSILSAGYRKYRSSAVSINGNNLGTVGGGGGGKVLSAIGKEPGVAFGWLMVAIGAKRTSADFSGKWLGRDGPISDIEYTSQHVSYSRGHQGV